MTVTDWLLIVCILLLLFKDDKTSSSSGGFTKSVPPTNESRPASPGFRKGDSK